MENQVRGDIQITHLDSDAPFFTKKVFGLPTLSEEQQMGLPVVGPDGDYTAHHSPLNPIEPVTIPADSPLLTVEYRDQMRKPYPMANAYDVCVMVAYVERHPEIEKIPDPQTRQELYDRAIRAAIRGFAGTAS